MKSSFDIAAHIETTAKEALAQIEPQIEAALAEAKTDGHACAPISIGIAADISKTHAFQQFRHQVVTASKGLCKDVRVRNNEVLLWLVEPTLANRFFRTRTTEVPAV